MLDTPRTVGEVTDRIRDLFDSDPLLADLWITGEVLESTVSRSGHVFFTLADERSQMRCVLFRMNALRQKTLPSPGSACVAHGRVEVYATEGAYQFYVDLVEDAGIGLAALEFELLRQQLEAEGLFSETRKRSLPANPAVIGVVTSATGAVWHDIQHVVRRRFPFVQLLMAPAAVQGEAAPASLVEALHSLVLDGRPELIVIARGGGSASDLSAFNDENLVRAVFAAPVPVVSAIGHETDWTLLDLVADLRAPTPSAAAELITPSIEANLATIRESIQLHAARFERDLTQRTLDLDRLGGRLDRSGPVSQISEMSARLSDILTALTTKITTSNASRTTLVGALSERLASAEHDSMSARAARAAHASDLLQALSPAKTMERGYAFVERRDSGLPVKSATDAAVGDHLRTRFQNGAIDSIVTSISTTS